MVIKAFFSSKCDRLYWTIYWTKSEGPHAYSSYASVRIFLKHTVDVLPRNRSRVHCSLRLNWTCTKRHNFQIGGAHQTIKNIRFTQALLSSMISSQDCRCQIHFGWQQVAVLSIWKWPHFKANNKQQNTTPNNFCACNLAIVTKGSIISTFLVTGWGLRDIWLQMEMPKSDDVFQ